jgi:hypothetical protein
MKKLFLWLLLPLMATANEIPAKAVTKEVTVFLSGAQITAESTVMIPKGNSTIIFNDLSTQIDENSIQISGLKDASVLAILYSINYLDRKTQTAQIKKLEEDILNQRKLINKLENKIVGLDEEMSLLANNKKLSSEQQAVSMEKMLSFAKYYRERSEAIKNEQFEVLPKFPGCDELLTFIRKHPEIEVEILTSSGGIKFHEEVKKQKKVWLKKYGISYKPHVVPGRKHKKEYAKPDVVLIDDTEDVIASFNKAGGIGILHKDVKETIKTLETLLNI